MKLVPRTRQYFSTWHHDFDEFFLLFLWFYTIFFQVSLVHDFCFFGQKSCHFGQKWYRLIHHNHLTNGICLKKRIHDFVFFFVLRIIRQMKLLQLFSCGFIPTWRTTEDLLQRLHFTRTRAPVQAAQQVYSVQLSVLSV